MYFLDDFIYFLMRFFRRPARRYPHPAFRGIGTRTSAVMAYPRSPSGPEVVSACRMDRGDRQPTQPDTSACPAGTKTRSEIHRA